VTVAGVTRSPGRRCRRARRASSTLLPAMIGDVGLTIER
jgi:hypothetical protein